MPGSASSKNSDRLSTLTQPDVLEAEPAEALDRIVALGRRIFDVPHVTIELVAEKREWFQAASGVNLEDPDRGTAFGAYVILDGDVLVVEDAATDDRFSDHPLVARPRRRASLRERP